LVSIENDRLRALDAVLRNVMLEIALEQELDCLMVMEEETTRELDTVLATELIEPGFRRHLALRRLYHLPPQVSFWWT